MILGRARTPSLSPIPQGRARTALASETTPFRRNDLPSSRRPRAVARVLAVGQPGRGGGDGGAQMPCAFSFCQRVVRPIPSAAAARVRFPSASSSARMMASRSAWASGAT